MRQLLYKSVLALLVTMAGCSTNPTDVEQGHGLLLESHPLVDRIIDVRQGQVVGRRALFREIIDKDYILLGEIHDNVVHHTKQQDVIDRLARANLDVSVSFEMIDQQQGREIEERKFASAEALISILIESDPGWSYEKYYSGLFDSTLAAGFEILPANIDRQSLMEMMRGADPVDPGIKQLLSEVDMSEHDIRHMIEDIADSHCGHLIEHMVKPMVTAQRARDAVMALSLAGSDARIRVLIAGTGHTRTDRGAPVYLRHIDPDGQVVSIAFMEVIEGFERFDQYNELWGETLPFDYIWFTPRAERSDPCEEMRQYMERTHPGDD